MRRLPCRRASLRPLRPRPLRSLPLRLRRRPRRRNPGSSTRATERGQSRVPRGGPAPRNAAKPRRSRGSGARARDARPPRHRPNHTGNNWSTPMGRTSPHRLRPGAPRARRALLLRPLPALRRAARRRPPLSSERLLPR
jgi:hypothetical protein